MLLLSLYVTSISDEFSGFALRRFPPCCPVKTRLGCILIDIVTLEYMKFAKSNRLRRNDAPISGSLWLRCKDSGVVAITFTRVNTRVTNKGSSAMSAAVGISRLRIGIFGCEKVDPLNVRSVL